MSPPWPDIPLVLLQTSRVRSTSTHKSKRRVLYYLYCLAQPAELLANLCQYRNCNRAATEAVVENINTQPEVSNPGCGVKHHDQSGQDVQIFGGQLHMRKAWFARDWQVPANLINKPSRARVLP